MAAEYQQGFPAHSDPRDVKTILGATVDSVVGSMDTHKSSGEGPTGSYKDLLSGIIWIAETPTTTNLPNLKVPAIVGDYVAGKLYVAVGTLGETPTSYAAQA